MNARSARRRRGIRMACAVHAAGSAHGAQAGFAYLALLILIAIIGVAAAASAELGSIYQRRMAEKELLFVGGEYQRAFLSYSSGTPLGQPTAPHALEDLLHDPRYPNPVRHLRKLYADPMTGKVDWVLVRAIDGQSIVGIHSASKAHPIQIAQFPDEFQGFEDKRSYVQWVFVARLPQLAPGQRTAIAPPGPGLPIGVSPDGMSGAGTSPSNGAFGNASPGNASPYGASSNNASPATAFPGDAATPPPLPRGFGNTDPGSP